MDNDLLRLVGVNASAAEDRISHLPNEVISHILSLVSTKEAVRISVLSTRWKPLWTSVPSLNLSDLDFPPRGNGLVAQRKENFLAFLQRFLMDGNRPCVNKFHIRCSDHYHLSTIESWIKLAKKLSAQELHLEMYLHEGLDNVYPQNRRLWFGLSLHRLESTVQQRSSFPYSGKLWMGDQNPSVVELFQHAANEFNVIELEYSLTSFEYQQSILTYRMLVVLKLHGYGIIGFPVASMCLPKLKVLHISASSFRNDTSASNLINSSSPVLEEVCLDRLNLNNLENLIFDAKTLKRLKVHFAPGLFERRLIWTIVNSPNLQNLDLHDEGVAKYSIQDLGALAEAKIESWGVVGSSSGEVANPLAAKHFFDLMTCIGHVKYLSLSDRVLLALQKASSFGRLRFHSLTRLEIHLYQRSSQVSLSRQSFLEFLKSIPNLEHLVFRATSFGLADKCDQKKQGDVPDCLASKLVTVEIVGIHNLEGLEFLRYMLLNCNSLRLMRIKFSLRRSRDTFRRSILALPKCSKQCLIKIE